MRWTPRWATGSARCSWRSARSACSPPRSASSTTCRGWWPTWSRCGYTERSRRWTESRLYFAVVWTMVIVGCLILLPGFDQPLVLVTISTVLGGFIMFIYSGLLVVTNRRYLPDGAQARRLPARDHRLRDPAPGRDVGRSSGSTSSGTCSDAAARGAALDRPGRVGGDRRGRLRCRACVGAWLRDLYRPRRRVIGRLRSVGAGVDVRSRPWLATVAWTAHDDEFSSRDRSLGGRAHCGG